MAETTPLEKVLRLIALATNDGATLEEGRTAASTACRLIVKHGLVLSTGTSVPRPEPAVPRWPPQSTDSEAAYWSREAEAAKRRAAERQKTEREQAAGYNASMSADDLQKLMDFMFAGNYGAFNDFYTQDPMRKKTHTTSTPCKKCRYAVEVDVLSSLRPRCRKCGTVQ